MRCFWLSVLLFVAVSVVVVQAQSHWESYTYYYYTWSTSCYWSYYYYCYDWWYYPYYYGYLYYNYYWNYYYYNWCYPRSYYNCYPYYYLTSATGQRCKQGWTGYNCDTAICSPACTGGQSCTAPNQCSCLNSGSGSKCRNVPCSGTNNCYPGTCTSGTCTCPSGFSGPNCLTLTFVPLIESCEAKIFGKLQGSTTEQVVASSVECTAPEVNRKTIWIPTSTLTQIQVGWLAKYTDPMSLPDNNDAPFIANAPVSIGVTVSGFTVSFPGYTAPYKSCPAAFVTDQTVPSTADCKNTAQQWSDLGGGNTQHNSTFTITVKASMGGRKKGSTSYQGDVSWGSGFTNQDFTASNQTLRQLTFGFDLRPPVHCLSTTTNCSIFPIYINDSVTVNSKIQPTISSWSDDASGIDHFLMQVFFMQPDSTYQLVEISSPLFQANISDSELNSLNRFQFTLTLGGTYSIWLSVFDRAGNSAKARKILTYINDATLTVHKDSLRIDKAGNNEYSDQNYTYITTLERPQNGEPYKFMAQWTNVFTSNIDPVWGYPVKPWDLVSNQIDDNYGRQFGMRSIDALPLTGVLSYQFAYVIDKKGGIGVNMPSNFTRINDTKTNQYEFLVDQNDLHSGDTIVVWVLAYGLDGTLFTAKTLAYVDTCKYCINVTDSQFKLHTDDKYTSSVYLTVLSKIGGIYSLALDIYDKTRRVDVISLKALPVQIRDSPSSAMRKKRDTPKICQPDDPTCYCIPLGQCYDVIQMIDIDNCLIDKFAGDTLRLTYNITTLSGHQFSGSIEVQPSPEQIPCRPLPIPSPGAIVGIVIAIIVGLIIIALLIIVIVRTRVQKKHPVPMRIRTMANDIRNHFTAGPSHTSENVIYDCKSNILKETNNMGTRGGKQLEEGDIYLSENGNPGGRISEKDIQLGEVVAEGRFAVIRKAYLMQHNERTPVAAKTLKSGYKDSDVGLLGMKIQFLDKEIPPHKNIVRYIGVVDKDNNIPPIMIMELCDMALKDWLGNIQNVDIDVLENMLTFMLNIAHGLQFLHSINVTHRRLAARNVLLKRTAGGLEAKLIGLDPVLDDVESGNSSAGQPTLPLKWLAPETLESLDNRKPTYDEKTDVWSFGVTTWEIYSLGSTPYPDQKSNDVRSLIQQGYRLPRPDNCPPELFDSVVSPCWKANGRKRPQMKSIVATIEEFRNGSAAERDLYYATEEQMKQFTSDELYDDAR